MTAVAMIQMEVSDRNDPATLDSSLRWHTLSPGRSSTAWRRLASEYILGSAGNIKMVSAIEIQHKSHRSRRAILRTYQLRITLAGDLNIDGTRAANPTLHVERGVDQVGGTHSFIAFANLTSTAYISQPQISADHGPLPSAKFSSPCISHSPASSPAIGLFLPLASYSSCSPQFPNTPAPIIIDMTKMQQLLMRAEAVTERARKFEGDADTPAPNFECKGDGSTSQV